MRTTLEDLMDKLGVGHVLAPYETCPWSIYDEESGVTCSAEVHMGPGGEDVEASIQMMIDEPPEDMPPMQQICIIKAAPATEDQWEVKQALLHGEPIDEEIYNREEKACNFFRAVANELMAGKVPDIEELIEQEIHKRERYHGGRGGGGGKSPKAKAGQFLGMKKGGGM